LGQILGAGNAAQVYEARIHGVPVAVKVAHVAGPFDQPWRSMPCADRLVIEIETYEALKALQGNIIPRIVAYGLIENRAGDFLPFLAMERIYGQTLEDAFKTMSEEEVPGAIKAVMKAYKQLHAAGYTQGSVKPPNVMVCSDGRAVIIDFGRGTSSYYSYEENEVHSMLVGLLADKLGNRSEARQKIEQWKGELSKAEHTSCTGSPGTASRYVA
jgi:serine/threonine protein kinase